MNRTIENKPSEETRAKRSALIAQRLSQLRRQRNMSQDALGALVGASQATVSRWEDPESLSSPAAVEVAEIALHFGVSAAWLLGIKDHPDELPVGKAILDQALLSAFARSKTAQELKLLLERDMTFGTLWVQIPEHAEIVPIEEALRRVKEVDRHVRRVHPELWHEWAGLVLG